MNEIADFYDAATRREWHRLTRSPYTMLEFRVFMHHIGNHLPGHGLILDAGGGAGRYLYLGRNVARTTERANLRTQGRYE